MGGTCSKPHSEDLGVLQSSYGSLSNVIPSVSFQDATEIDRLLNLLHNNEVEMLTQIFTYHCQHTIDSKRKSYHPVITDINALLSLFPQLQKPDLSLETLKPNIFLAFDIHGKRYVDLKDFCRVYVISTRGSALEMIELLFVVFSESHFKNESPDRSLSSRKVANIRRTHPTSSSSSRPDEAKLSHSPGASKIYLIPQTSTLRNFLDHVKDASHRFISLQRLSMLLEDLCYEDNIARAKIVTAEAEQLCPMSLSTFKEFMTQFVGVAALQHALSVFDLLPKLKEVFNTCLLRANIALIILY